MCKNSYLINLNSNEDNIKGSLLITIMICFAIDCKILNRITTSTLQCFIPFYQHFKHHSNIPMNNVSSSSNVLLFDMTLSFLIFS